MSRKSDFSHRFPHRSHRAGLKPSPKKRMYVQIILVMAFLERNNQGQCCGRIIWRIKARGRPRLRHIGNQIDDARWYETTLWDPSKSNGTGMHRLKTIAFYKSTETTFRSLAARSWGEFMPNSSRTWQTRGSITRFGFIDIEWASVRSESLRAEESRAAPQPRLLGGQWNSTLHICIWSR